MSGTSGVAVARLCVRCNLWVLRWLGDTIRDGLGYRYFVCMDCRRPDDRVAR